jgi:hypothetical protein
MSPAATSAAELKNVAYRCNDFDSFTLRFWYNESQLVKLYNVEYDLVCGTADGAQRVWACVELHLDAIRSADYRAEISGDDEK